LTQKQINELRAALGITQKQLAEIVGCSLASAEHWCRGYRSPSDEFNSRLKRLWRKAQALEKAQKKFDPVIDGKDIARETPEDVL